MHLHKACLPALLPEMTPERVRAFWVGETARSAGDGVQKAVVAKAFGERVVQAVPVTRRFDHHAEAERLGHAVVQSAHLMSGFRQLLRLQVPTAAAVVRKAMGRRAEAAMEVRLGWADVAALDPVAEQPDAPGAARAIMRFGRKAVLTRMDFARWFAEAVMECRHCQPRLVPVQVACLENAAATWSPGDVLTLNLAAEAFWQEPFGRAGFELLLHKLAHHEVRRLGRSFSEEIEACAGAAAEVMLARADEARRLFPGLLSGSPGKAPAVPEGPALEVAGKSGLPQARSRLGESTSRVHLL